MKKWNLIVNVGRCENCYNCVISTRDEYTGNDFPGYTAPAAAAGEAPIRIMRRVQGAEPMVEATYLPVMCNHCDDAPCMKTGGDAIRRRKDGIVIIDPVKAKGRRDIVDACPYEAIVWNEELQLPQTWIFDAHLLDGGWPHPRCQQSCPTNVFETVKLDDRAMQKMAEKEGLEVLRPDLRTRPRVWYRGLERWKTCFVGGSVSEKINGLCECVTDAQVRLIKEGATIATTLTDGFGDFKFSGLPAFSGVYRVEVHHPHGEAYAECTLDESVYLGELMLGETPLPPRQSLSEAAK